MSGKRKTNDSNYFADSNNMSDRTWVFMKKKLLSEYQEDLAVYIQNGVAYNAIVKEIERLAGEINSGTY
jgi:hypothetical protein